MLSGAVNTCDILLKGTQAMKPNAIARWNHQMTTWPVCIAASLMSRSEAIANQVADGRPGGPDVVGDRDPPALDQEAGEGHDEDRDQDPARLVGVDQLRRLGHPAANRAQGDANEHEQTEDVDNQRLEDQVEVPLHDVQGRVVVDRHHGGRQKQDDEAGVDEAVEEARVTAAQGAALTDGVSEEELEPLAQPVEPHGRLTGAPAADLDPETPCQDGQGGDHQDVYQPCVLDVPEDLACCLGWIHGWHCNAESKYPAIPVSVFLVLTSCS